MNIEKKKNILKVVAKIIYLCWFVVWCEAGLNYLNLKVIPFLLVLILGNIILVIIWQCVYKMLDKRKSENM
ncbi:hypothetical protein [Clostridium sp. C8-1-8]|uniref:hypothetical protein n=1 Tax=Clostridium sp. C8-1-8 TaxID=2698831 RepID=UPI0013713D1E|nr:hypothetical protein [Clostridium sp. C8-1-8]